MSFQDDAPMAADTQSLHPFMGIELELAADVLVPREETELLGNRAVTMLRERPAGSVVVDMCCGSGNLALGIAYHVPSARVWAADLTEATIALATRNAERLGLADRVAIRRGDLFAALAEDHLVGKLDLVVCNPPYISTGRLEGESAHLLRTEPREAFDGGPYGLSIQQRLIRDSVAYLKPGGWLAFEFGAGQERQAAALIKRTRSYDTIEFTADEKGIPRVASARRAGDQDRSTSPSKRRQ